MTALVMNTMGTLESALRTLITGYAIATGKIKQQFIHNRTRQALAYLSDRELKDIGLTRDQLERGQF
tara:strand:- start:819 stop:1019 length:201 start_codon:yes stop_codon:yes gene_type:complete